MEDRLSPCLFCARHVRVSEATCPFCAGALGAGWDASAPGPSLSAMRAKGPLTRAALLFMGAAAAAGCSDPVSVYGPGPVNDDAGIDAGRTDAGALVPLDAAPADAGEDANDSGGPVAIYSAAPIRETR